MTVWLRIFLALIVAVVPASAWEGSDENGNSVEIEQGNLVRTGNEIEILDHSTGEYHDAEVASINRYGSTVELEVYDHDTGEYRTLEMED